MNNPRNYSSDGEVRNIRVAEPHPAGPTRRAERLYTETAPDFANTADMTPGADPYRTEPPKKDRSGAMVRTAIFALLLGAGVVAWGSYAANRPAEPVIAENSVALEDGPIAVQPSAALPMTTPEIAPTAEVAPPAPAPRAGPARAERRAAPVEPAATPEPAPIEPTPIAPDPTPDPTLNAAPPAPAPAPTPVEPLSM